MTDLFLLFLLSRIENAEERQVLADLYLNYKGNIAKFISAHLKANMDDIEDCVQQCYLNVARNIGKVAKYEPEHQLAYLLTTARTTVQQFLLRQKEIVFADLDEEELEKQVYNSRQYSELSAEYITAEREVLRKFYDRLSELSPAERAVFDLYILGDMDRETLANQLGISSDSVRTYISRTTRHTKQILKEVCDFE